MTFGGKGLIQQLDVVSLHYLPCHCSPTNSQCIGDSAELLVREFRKQRHAPQDAQAHVVLQDSLNGPEKLEEAGSVERQGLDLHHSFINDGEDHDQELRN